ncbi:MAG: type II toxin-antitoxin system HicB family antitoxin [Stellaceae bacterium]
MVAYSYPATLEPDADGRLVVHFPTLPEALTDGADEAEALREAADCLSEALASRIVDGEEIPAPGPLASGQYLISPDPTIALKAALYEALHRRDMTVADLAERLGMDWHQAARLIDPKRSSKLTSLAAALGALDCEIRLLFHDPKADGGAQQGEGSPCAESVVYGGFVPASAVPGGQQTLSLSDAALRAVQAHGGGATAQEIREYLSQEFEMTVRPNHLGIVLHRHRRAGRLENRDQQWYPPSANADTSARSRGARMKRD